jgi:zinc transporter, ZIP family
MPDSLPSLLVYTLIPVVAIVVGSCLAVARTYGRRLISGFQHFAAGVVFAAVTVELVPRLHEIDAPVWMSLGFVTGLAAMLASKRLFAGAGATVPMAVDLFIDGLLIAIGMAAGKFGGMVLLVGLTVEALSLGLSSTPSLVGQGRSRAAAIAIMGGLGLMILVGASAGYTAAGASPRVLAAILGIGVSSLLYLVTEDLLLEAHDTEDTPLVTATFFVGFLIPILLADL